MTRTPLRLAPRMDALEARLALSTAAAQPDTVLTPAEYATARVQIDIAVTRLALTGDEARADASLAQATRKIPDGADLLPTLKSELDSANVTNFRTARAARQQLLNSLDAFIREGVADGDFTVARGLRGRFPAPTQGAGSLYFPVQNQTNLRVNFTLTQAGNPTSPQSTAINPGRPANVSFNPNSSVPVVATVTEVGTSRLLGQKILPASFGGVILKNTNNIFTITFTG